MNVMLLSMAALKYLSDGHEGGVVDYNHGPHFNGKSITHSIDTLIDYRVRFVFFGSNPFFKLLLIFLPLHAVFCL